jgi:predicted neutral ceramidase superfamily lipid hydrolase
MKRFEVYKNIRKRAVIMGLPISLFALMITAVIGSLLLIIFSFSFVVIISVLVFNTLLYISLTHIVKNPALLHFIKVFPQTISNKKESQLFYEEN